MSLMQEPAQVQSDPSTPKPGSKRKRTRQTTQLTFHGVRQRRWGSYVSEIRLPGQKTRIWLGSFGSPEMAARAYDSAAFFLKGNSAALNFPDSAGSLPRPESSSRRDIQLAAAKAAAAVQNKKRASNGVESGSEAECESYQEPMPFEQVKILKRDRMMSPLRFDSDVGELYCFMDDDEFLVESCFEF